MIEYTVYIVPGVTEMASQCRIYAKEKALIITSPSIVGRRLRVSEDYNRNPDSWTHVALMNSRGELVYCNSDVIREELRAAVPLMGGSVFNVSLEDYLC